MKLDTLFHQMVRIRMVEEAIADHYSEQEMRCPVHLSIGQEAVAVGICSQLYDTDFLVSNHRAHAHYLAKGGSLNAMIAEIYGKETGCSRGRGGSMHLVDPEKNILGTTPIVGGSLPVAVGSAFASYLRDEPHCTCVFFGEGATEEGVFSECLNFASLHNLPVLFVCENNFYSVYSPMKVRQSPKRSRIGIAEAHGISSFKEDGNDVEKVYHAGKKAIEHIRAKKGPYFLEFTTYRLKEHCGPNIDTMLGYRSYEEVEAWEKRCPIEKLKKQCTIDVDALTAEIKEAFCAAKNAPYPESAAFHEEVFA